MNPNGETMMYIYTIYEEYCIDYDTISVPIDLYSEVKMTEEKWKEIVQNAFKEVVKTGAEDIDEDEFVDKLAEKIVETNPILKRESDLFERVCYSDIHKEFLPKGEEYEDELSALIDDGDYGVSLIL